LKDIYYNKKGQIFLEATTLMARGYMFHIY